MCLKTPVSRSHVGLFVLSTFLLDFGHNLSLSLADYYWSPDIVYYNCQEILYDEWCVYVCMMPERRFICFRQASRLGALLLLLLSRFSCVRLCATPETAAYQTSPSLGFSRQEHWSGLPFPSPMHEREKWKWSRSVVSYSQWPHGLQPSRLLCPWDFPGKNTGVGCHCPLRLGALITPKLLNLISKWSSSEVGFF